ncbi:MAG: hypothetical protein FWF57_02775 [Defluviitaleaceae bacterium]|nr:hypothetical protein [Defluviitaleaceae bacterium]
MNNNILRKTLVTVLASITLLNTTPIFANETNVRVRLNGDYINANAIIHEGRTLVPAKGL